MNTPTINTIMTFVVRMQEPVSLFLPDNTYRVVRWVNEFAEPQVFYPAIDEHTPVECGIVGCITFLREVSLGTTYRVEPKYIPELEDEEPPKPRMRPPTTKRNR